MNLAELRFTEHFDTLVALVTHLSSTRYKSRLPTNIADALGLDRDEVIEVLQLFPGFFRRSKTKDKDKDEYFYTVHLRYARRSQGDSSEPLSPEELSSLFSLITQMTTHEHESSLLAVEVREAQKGVQQTTRDYGYRNHNIRPDCYRGCCYCSRVQIMKFTRYSKFKGLEPDESSDPDAEEAWAAEIERRIAEVESGEVETVSWEEARTRIRATLAKSWPFP